MPYLALVHLRELRCKTCNGLLALAGARSFIVDLAGEPHNFDGDAVPEEMTLEIQCANRHDTTLLVPNEIAAEEVLVTPEEAPIGLDATLVP